MYINRYAYEPQSHPHPPYIHIQVNNILHTKYTQYLYIQFNYITAVIHTYLISEFKNIKKSHIKNINARRGIMVIYKSCLTVC